MAARSNKQKLKILYLMDILLEKTDENHFLSMDEILEELLAYGVEAERKSIYNDIENLKLYGLDIIGEKVNRNYVYHVGRRQFELAELKLLVDSVQSSRFITAKKSDELIKKIESLASRQDASALHRQVYITDRVKTENESIFYNVDYIHQAIAVNKKITFQYYNWDVKKKRVFHRDGELYKLSPWALLWNSENYYLVAYDSDENKIKHFRVDKMLHISICEDAREGQSEFKNFDMGSYSKSMFGMFGGEVEIVNLRCADNMAGVVIDRFGKNITMFPDGDGHFTINVPVAVSDQFFGWVLALNKWIKVIGPENVLRKMQDTVEDISSYYLKSKDETER